MMTITSSTRTVHLSSTLKMDFANDEDAEVILLRLFLSSMKNITPATTSRIGDYLTSQIIMITEISASTLMDSGKIRDIMRERDISSSLTI